MRTTEGEVSRLAIADCEINDRSGVVRVRAGKGGNATSL
jgi:hypothetical protein